MVRLKKKVKLDHPMLNSYHLHIDDLPVDPMNSLVACPKCGGSLREVHNLKKDGKRRKNDKIVDLICDACRWIASEVEIPKQ